MIVCKFENFEVVVVRKRNASYLVGLFGHIPISEILSMHGSPMTPFEIK